MYTRCRFTKEKILKSGLKLIGGKTKQRDLFYPLFPEHKIYLEPFVGSANVIVGKPPAEVEVVNDLNPYVKEFFEVLQICPEEFLMWYRFESAPPLDEKDFQRWKKDISQDYKYKLMSLAPAERACLFYMITKICRNGIFRFNKKGECNSSFGSTQGRGLFPDPDKDRVWFDAVCERVKNIKFCSQDFEDFIDHNIPESGNCFIFLDPPYRYKKIKGDKGCVTTYWGKKFVDEDHLRLFMTLHSLSLGVDDVKWLMTINDDDWIRELYKDYCIVPRSQFYSCSNTKAGRGERPELIIANYDIETMWKKNNDLQTF